MPSTGARVSVRLNDRIGAQHRQAEPADGRAYNGCLGPGYAGSGDDLDRLSSLYKKYRQNTLVCNRKSPTRYDYTYGRAVGQIKSGERYYRPWLNCSGA